MVALYWIGYTNEIQYMLFHGNDRHRKNAIIMYENTMNTKIQAILTILKMGTSIGQVDLFPIPNILGTLIDFHFSQKFSS